MQLVLLIRKMDNIETNTFRPQVQHLTLLVSEIGLDNVPGLTHFTFAITSRNKVVRKGAVSMFPTTNLQCKRGLIPKTELYDHMHILPESQDKITTSTL